MTTTAPAFWSHVDATLREFTSALTSDPRLAVWLLGEHKSKVKPDTAVITRWRHRSLTAEHVTTQLLLSDPTMWDAVGEDTGYTLCAALVSRPDGNPVQALNLRAATPASGQGICYGLSPDSVVAAFATKGAEASPLMPARKHSALFARMRVRINNDAVLTGYLRSAGLFNQHQRIWYDDLMRATDPLIAAPEAATTKSLDWNTWLELGRALFALLPDSPCRAHTWLPAVFAFRIAWLVFVELESYVEWKKQQQETKRTRTITLAQAMRGNPRAANGFETYHQMQIRKQLQAEAYGWAYTPPQELC